MPLRFLRHERLIVEDEMQDVPLYEDDAGQLHAFPVPPSVLRQVQQAIDSAEGWSAQVSEALGEEPLDWRPPQVG